MHNFGVGSDETNPEFPVAPTVLTRQHAAKAKGQRPGQLVQARGSRQQPSRIPA